MRFILKQKKFQRTEGEINRSLSTLSVPTTVVDLGKQLLQYARDSDLKGVKNALSRGAPFTSDWVSCVGFFCFCCYCCILKESNRFLIVLFSLFYFLFFH